MFNYINLFEMIMHNIIIFPVIFFFLNTSPPLKVDDNVYVNETRSTVVYLIKQYWHTAIVFSPEAIDTTIFPEAKLFMKYKLLDIGWGDAAFYQHPGFDSGLAFDALFYPTPSTLRMEGIGISKQTYFDISEIVIELNITETQLKKILTYISSSIVRDANGEPVILSEAGLGRIKFFESNGEYHLFNTCNTWLARGLKQAGVKIKDDIILTEQLFNEATKVGKVIKAE